MALTQSVTINGRDARTAFGLEILSIDTRGLGPTRRSSTVGGELVGRIGATAFHDEQIIHLSGQISGANHSNLMALIKSLVKQLNVGQDGRRQVTLKFEDSTSEWVGQYAGDFRIGDISHSWYINYIAEISFSIIITAGSAVDFVGSHSFTGMGDKICKLVIPANADYPIQPYIVLKNTNALAVTSLTLINYAKRRIQRKLTGTLSGTASFTLTDGAFGRGLSVVAGADVYSFATSKLFPFSGAWTLAFRFKRVFTSGANAVFWETTSNNNRLQYNNANGNLELILNGATTASWPNILASLPTTSFTWVVCRNRINPNLTMTQDIFINGETSNSGSGSPPTDPGTNIYFGSKADNTQRATGIYDEIIIWNRALSEEEITYINGLNRPPATLEDICLYVDFENGVNGVGYSNIETVFTGISLAQNDSLVIDNARQTVNKITNLITVTDQLSTFSGEFMSFEPRDNLFQLLQTGGGATGTDVSIFYSPRRAA